MNILHFKCSLHFKNNIVNIVCYILQQNNNSYNEIRNRTGVRLQATFRGVSLVKEFERFGESVINNPFISTAICFLTE